MSYIEFLPHPLLRQVVECYWSARGKSMNAWTVYPDACMDIIFNFGDQTSEVVGNMFTPIQAQFEGYSDILGIRFRAGGMARVLNVPLAEFNDTSASLDTVYSSGPEIGKLQPLSLNERVSALDRWLLKRIIFSNNKPQPWEYCLNAIVARQGNLNVYDLSKEAGISQKQLERKFIEKVGPTPKQFAQLLKFRKLKDYLLERKGESLMTIAFDFGFTDHAHLTRFFKKFADITPTEFCRENTKA